MGLALFSCQARRAESEGPSHLAPKEPSRAEPVPAEAFHAPRAPDPPLPGDPKPRRTYHVAALGDSISDERVGGGRYLQFLRQACPASRFYSFGKGGDMTNQMRRRLASELLPERTRLDLDTLIVLGGVNDLYSNLTAGRTNSRIEEDLTGIYQTAKQVGLRVVAITVLPWGGFTSYFTPARSLNTRALNSFVLGQVALGQVDVAVDGYSLLSCGDAERLCPRYENARPDGLHPGPMGHERLGRALHEQAFSDCL
jgi:lysophospholipase L1-like esterase